MGGRTGGAIELHGWNKGLGDDVSYCMTDVIETLGIGSELRCIGIFLLFRLGFRWRLALQSIPYSGWLGFFGFPGEIVIGDMTIPSYRSYSASCISRFRRQCPSKRVHL